MTLLRVRVLLRLLGAGLVATGTLCFVPAAGAATYSNTAPIDVPDATMGTVAGEIQSKIHVTGAQTVSSVSVTLLGVTSEYPDDLDIWLEAPPQGAQPNVTVTDVVLMSDAGGPSTAGPNRELTAPSNATITNPTDISFTDSGATMPNETLITSGTYRPSNYPANGDPGCTGEGDPWPGYGTSLSAFNTQNPNGDWWLILHDDCEIYLSHVTGGWRLTINNPTAAGVTSLRGTATGSAVILRWATGTENDMLGFNVYRAAKGSLVKVNRRLIPAKATGTARGAQYRFVDRRELTGSARYRLQVVHLDGTRAWAGSVNVYAGAISPSLASR